MSDAEILQRYMGLKDFPCSISSPLREDDEHPSFSFTERNGTVFWKDFGTGEVGTATSLMAKLWNVSYSEALLKIKFDSGEPIPRVGLIRKYKGKVHLTKASSLKVKVREWKDWDREFWSSFGISQRFATWCNVYPISHAFFTRPDENGKDHTTCVPMDKYAYAYFEWKDGKQSVKLYQPYSQTMKWLSKHDASVWDLWKHAFRWADKNSDEAVIITSSRKDAMCLWENLGVPAMSLQGEGYLPKPQVMKQVLERFKTVYLWYDNDFKHKEDNPGQDNAKKIIELYPTIRNICIPSDYQCKDPSDLYKTWGYEILKEVWNEQKEIHDSG
ncbi:MAG: toprim domain-containing protein [Lachnospiraceae bacterium]|nr:toprim domain-containing protein [Lachnospiraceae bacterium]